MGMVMATPAPGVIPEVKVSDQTIQNGIVRVDQVVSNGPGWITIYTVVNDQPDQPLGHAPVQNGNNKNVTVQIDATKATPTLYALLQVDAGTVGVFEFPGPDGAVMLGVRMIARPFKNLAIGAPAAPTTQAAPVPLITVQDQPIHNGTIVISQVVSIGETWLVIHPQNPDGSTGNFIGYALVHDGINTNVPVKIDVSRTTRVLYGMLHVNAAKAASPQFPGADEPVMVGGKMLLPPFRVIGELAGDVPLGVAKNSSGTPYLVDGMGTSLYIFLNDTPGKSNCTGDCLVKFRPLKATGKLVPGNGVLVGKLGVIGLPDGTRQVTYSGAPLYYYTADTKPGDTLGQGEGGLWFLVTP
jgi:predicted lipoprotein with Yx(FWY)xxD motif